MTETEKKYLSDIISANALIDSFMTGVSSFEIYVADLKTKSAVERQLGIIGEAVSKFMKESNRNELANARRIISLRNRLIHGYDSIEDSII